MKKYVLTIALVLLLLVSCATKKVEQEQNPEVVETAVIEQLPPSVPATVVDEVPPAEEAASSQEASTSENVETLTEVVAPLEDIPSEIATPDSSEAPVTDWGYVFTSPSTEETAKAQTPSAPAKAAEVKTETPKASTTVSQSQSAAVEEQKSNPFIYKVISFISHEKLFSLGLVISLAGLIYFIIALVKSSGMVVRKKTVERRVEEQPVETSPSNEDVEMQDNSSTGFSSEEENDAFLRALLGEDKK